MADLIEAKIEKFANLNIRISPGFGLLEKEMTFVIYTVSFKTIQSIHFSKWRLLIFSGGNHPRTRHL